MPIYNCQQFNFARKKLLKYNNFGKHCTFVDGIAPHSEEFASFRRQAWSNAQLFSWYGGT